MPGRARVAVFGGSYDPPHVGHAMVAAWLLWSDRADRVWLLPSFAHPFGKVSAPFERRVALCEALAATVDPERVAVCAVERELPSPTYTVDTLDHLAARHPDLAFRLVVGSDVLPTVDRWKDWPGILARYAPIVAGRPGYPAPEDAVTFPDVSSTAIRDRLADGRPVDHLVPARVLALLRS